MIGELECLAAPAAVLGEGAVWDGDRGRLLWVDCDQKILFDLDVETGALSSIVLAHNPGSYALRRQGGMVMAYRNGLVIVNQEAGQEEPIEVTGVDYSVERFNDGACDRAGRFWVGTMDKRLREPVGSLFRLDPDRSFHLIEPEITCSNGIAFSPDDRVMYHTDTGAGRIYAYDFDIDTASVRNRRVFADFHDEPGRPDGCTLDSEGCLWVAEVGGGQVVRLDPSGRQVAAVSLPVQRPTSVALGGHDLRTLYITTMRFGMTPEQVAQSPEAGRTFAVEVDVAGLPEARYAG